MATTADSHLPRSAAHLVWFGSKCCVKKPLIRLEARIIYSCRFPILENRLSIYKLSCKDEVRHCLKCLSYNVQPEGSDTRSCSTVFFCSGWCKNICAKLMKLQRQGRFPTKLDVSAETWSVLFRVAECFIGRFCKVSFFCRKWFCIRLQSTDINYHKLIFYMCRTW